MAKRMNPEWKKEREKDERYVIVAGSKATQKSGGKVTFSTTFLRELAMKRFAEDIRSGKVTTEDLLAARREEINYGLPVPV